MRQMTLSARERIGGRRAGKPKAPRRDPAPSRMAYRFQRLSLTPSFRRACVFGTPVVALALTAGLTFADQGRRDAMRLWVDGVKAEFQSRDEFMVRELSIIGATESVAQDIREILSLDFPSSSFDLNLRHMQEQVSGLNAVKDADLRIRSGGVLDIRVAERVPALVWRSSDGLLLLDSSGHRVSGIEARAVRSDLPLISGLGADKAADEAVRLIRAAKPVAPRLRGFVRIGERRWDVILSDGQKIKLPERDPLRALEQVIAVDEAQDLFARDVMLVDMRNPRRPTVRLAPEAADALRQVKMIELGDD